MKYIIVTGGTGNLGLVICKKLLLLGYGVINLSTKDLPVGYEQVINIPIDLLSRESIKNAYLKIKKLKLDVYGIINNAGITDKSDFMFLNFDDFSKLLNVNVINQLYLNQCISKLFVRKKEGLIITISSNATKYVDKGFFAYTLSKRMLIDATMLMANDLSSYGVRVNCISPGIINNQMGRLNSEEYISTMKSRSFGNVFVSDDAITNTISFILENDTINGQNIYINNGCNVF